MGLVQPVEEGEVEDGGFVYGEVPIQVRDILPGVVDLSVQGE